MSEATELTTEAILDAWVRTGRVPEGGWTVPRLVAAIQAEARASLDVEALFRSMSGTEEVVEGQGIRFGLDANLSDYAEAVAIRYRAILAEADR